MPTNTIESTSKSDRKWNDVQDMIAELVLESHVHPPITAKDAATVDHHAIADGAEHPSPATGSVPTDLAPDQLASDIAEIERAVAALRKGEPDLEPWTAGAPAATEQRKPRSIWFFIGTIWIATVLVTGAATLAITSLL